MFEIYIYMHVPCFQAGATNNEPVKWARPHWAHNRIDTGQTPAEKWAKILVSRSESLKMAGWFRLVLKTDGFTLDIKCRALIIMKIVYKNDLGRKQF
jgi:hypothetical protein